MQPGEYYIHIKFNNEHVPESPARIIVTPDSADAKKVCIQGLKERGLDVSTVHSDNVVTFTFSLMAHDVTHNCDVSSARSSAALLVDVTLSRAMVRA
jgi:hypothetical protein